MAFDVKRILVGVDDSKDALLAFDYAINLAKDANRELVIVSVLENDEMKDKFLTRLGEIYQFMTTETMTNELNAMAAILEPEMTMHFNRWAEENDKAINFDSPTTPEGALRYWNTRLNFTRNVLKKRPTYFYEMVQERFNLSDEQMLNYFGEKPELPSDAIVTEGKKWG